MLRNNLKTLALLVCLFYLSGCASIVSGGAKTLPIMSQPDEAKCEIINMRTGDTILKAKTPYTALLDRDAGFFTSAKYNIRISKEGYLPYEQEISAGINGWYFGNIVFGGLLGILLVDPATGAMWRISEDKVSVKLYQDTVDGRLEKAKDDETKAKTKALEASLSSNSDNKF